ncbi:hypothetical protein AX17_002778 [Amanita inopinata Kibby_2008]|nr:hypothetical protein AX17_002778 [Amanita inopinata Kibby_2008]
MSFAFVQTRIVGGMDGKRFDDVEDVAGWPSTQNIDLNHPIAKLEISSGWVVDGIAVTYRLDNGKTKRVMHGSDFGPKAHVIDLSCNEVVMAIYGRAGQESCYKKKLIGQIAFLIYDTARLRTRVAGPYGDATHCHEGKPFYVTSPMALSGFTRDGAEGLGLSGLSFTKALGNL